MVAGGGRWHGLGGGALHGLGHGLGGSMVAHGLLYKRHCHCCLFATVTILQIVRGFSWFFVLRMRPRYAIVHGAYTKKVVL